jgi:hypothetical protein
MCLSAVPGDSAETVYVSPTGDDTHSGSETQPFKTLEKAASVLKDGGTCALLGGRYRTTETITGYRGEAPLNIVAKGEPVVFDGRDPVAGTWTVHEGGIMKIKATGDIEQVFVGDEMMVEARWPNMKFPEQLWNKKNNWRSAAKGSKQGRMVSPALKETDIDWTGATAVLNISHQWWTWTSEVTHYDRENNVFHYDTERHVKISRGAASCGHSKAAGQ